MSDPSFQSEPHELRDPHSESDLTDTIPKWDTIWRASKATDVAAIFEEARRRGDESACLGGLLRSTFPQRAELDETPVTPERARSNETSDEAERAVSREISEEMERADHPETPVTKERVE